ncbi:MAG: kinase [Micavibrio sp.]|nr:kinase [Micavibrio sp.]
MTQQTVHFIYDPCKQPDADFAADLIAVLGQAPAHSAQNIVTIGGDGTLLHALHHAQGKRVLGLVPPGSNSRGFWTNRNIDNPAALCTVLTAARSYPIKPLQVDITFADGTTTMRQAYNDVSIRPVAQAASAGLKASYNLPAEDISIQSALLNLRVEFAKAVLGPHRIMGGGLVFATPLGSTAMNKSYGGPSADIRNEVIVMTGIGISEPPGGFNSVVNRDDTRFTIEVLSREKRPVIISFDSFGLIANAAGSPVSSIKIHAAQSGAVNLVLTDDPGTRAYSSMAP